MPPPSSSSSPPQDADPASGPLLSSSPPSDADADADEDEDLIVTAAPDLSVDTHVVASKTPDLVSPAARTPNRVRFALDDDVAVEQAFELEERRLSQSRDPQDDIESPRTPRGWGGLDREDYLRSPSPEEEEREDDRGRAPLLTDIEAPSVTVAGIVDAEEVDRERRRPKSGMRMAFMNMANSIIGAGIIGQPYAFRQAGLLAGIFLLVALTFVIDWTINLIVINSKLSGADSFQTTVERCFGRTGLAIISVAQWAFAFGGMLAFCIIIGDTIPHVFKALFPNLHEIPIFGLLTNRRAVIMIFTLGISYPLTLYRDIAKLAKASALALISMFIIVFTVITQGFMVPASSRGSFSTPLLTVNDGIFQAIGVISFAFVCHHNSLLIYGSLRKPTLDRFATVTHFSTGISMVMCLLMATAGFLTFRDKTEGNVLNNFPADNIMVNIARFCFGLNMLTTLPLEAFVCREVMENYYFPTEPFSLGRHLIFSSALVMTAMALALTTCDLGAVFELIGATSACALAYILPPLCYIKLATRSWRTYAAGATAAFGGAVLVISLVQAAVKIWRGGGDVVACGW